MSTKLMMIGVTMALLSLVPAASAGVAVSAGNECNPGVVDFKCTYEYGGKTYDCTVWTGVICVVDASGIVLIGIHYA